MNAPQFLRQTISLIGTAALLVVPTTMSVAADASAADQPTIVPTQSTVAVIAAARSGEIFALEPVKTILPIGEVTRLLLQAQADGHIAGARLPILGATADSSWQRYLESFRQPWSEFFGNNVSKN